MNFKMDFISDYFKGSIIGPEEIQLSFSATTIVGKSELIKLIDDLEEVLLKITSNDFNENYAQSLEEVR